MFCAAFDLPDLLPEADPTLASNRSRVEQRERLLPLVTEAFSRYTKADLMILCERTGLPYAPITRPEELFDDPQVNQPGGLVPVTLPDGREIRLPALPVEMSGQRLGVRLDLPGLGEHGAALAGELGYAPEEIDQLIADGVLTVPR
jgi:crotonobetainyl-CoA:carnitine CoA-transferase CaiB-like acyl-CoA transferase